MRGEAAEEVRPQHRRHHRAVAAARFAGDAAVRRRLRAFGSARRPRGRSRRRGRCGSGPCPASRGTGVPPRTSRRRSRPETRGRRLAGGEELVHQLRRVLAEGRAIAPHVELSGQALDQVDRGVAVLGLVVVAGRRVDPERSHVWIAERVPFKRLTLERVLFEAAGEVDRPGQHAPDATEARGVRNRSMSRQPCGFGSRPWARLSATTTSVGIVSILNCSTSSALSSASTRTSSNGVVIGAPLQDLREEPSTRRQRPEDAEWKKTRLGFAVTALLADAVICPALKASATVSCDGSGVSSARASWRVA